MDILEKIELYIGEEISGTPAGTGTGGNTGTTTTDVARYERRSNVINRKKKKSDDEDSEEEIRTRANKQVKSGTAALNGLGAKNGSTAAVK